MLQKSISAKKLSELTGESDSTVTTRMSRLKRGKGVTTTTLEKTAKALDIEVSELIM